MASFGQVITQIKPLWAQFTKTVGYSEVCGSMDSVLYYSHNVTGFSLLQHKRGCIACHLTNMQIGRI